MLIPEKIIFSTVSTGELCESPAGGPQQQHPPSHTLNSILILIQYKAHIEKRLRILLHLS